MKTTLRNLLKMVTVAPIAAVVGVNSKEAKPDTSDFQIVDLGPWHEVKCYERGESVAYNGKFYVCIRGGKNPEWSKSI